MEDEGFSKGTLHYMKKNAKEEKLFTLNKHIRERIDKEGIPIKAGKLSQNKI